MSLIEIAVVICILAVLATMAIMPPIRCESQGKAMSLPTKFEWIGGCYIEHKPGKWIPIGQYRVID